MSKTIRVLKVSGVLLGLILSVSAFADIEQSATVTGLGTSFETDEGMGLQSSDEIQDLDQSQNPSGDTKDLSQVLTDKITTTQAMHAGDEEVSEPVSDEF